MSIINKVGKGGLEGREGSEGIQGLGEEEGVMTHIRVKLHI